MRQTLDLSEIRKLIIVSVASDDVLMERLVLKGGNALELIHRIGERASLDLDFSIEDDFENLEEIEKRLFGALRDRFDSAGLVVFDEHLGPRPATPSSKKGVRWGGYVAEFKIISRSRWRELKGDVEAMRREAEVSGPHKGRKFKIDISKYEYCSGKQRAVVDDYECYVYTPAMIGAEKLRAICQQMPGPQMRSHPAPRARDFYDIHAVAVHAGVEFGAAEMRDLVRHMFVAKDVPLALLGDIDKHREFHRAGWPSVELAVRGTLKPFDFYVDFVLAEVAKLQALWVVDAPSG
jgi:hypothetical protein